MGDIIPPREKKRREAQAVAADFGANLKSARTAQGLTLRQVSEHSGLSITYLSDLERGVLQNPTLNALRAIAKAVHTPLNDLVGVDEEDSETQLLPTALEKFASGDTFIEAIDAEAQRRRVSLDHVRETWLTTLARIEIDGRRPKQPSDYLLIFETLRRVIPG